MKYFQDAEFKKDPDKVDQLVKDGIDRIRDLAGCKIFINVAWDDSGHSKRSYHYKGEAIDFHFEPNKLTLPEQFSCICAVRDFRGIGFYPWWNSPGWHIDTRASSLFWLSPEKGKYIYTADALIKEMRRE